MHPALPQGRPVPALLSRTGRTDLIGLCRPWCLRYTPPFICPPPCSLCTGPFALCCALFLMFPPYSPAFCPAPTVPQLCSMLSRSFALCSCSACCLLPSLTASPLCLYPTPPASSPQTAIFLLTPGSELHACLYVHGKCLCESGQWQSIAPSRSEWPA